MAIGERGKQAKDDAAAVNALAEALRIAKDEYSSLAAAQKAAGPPTQLDAAKAAVVSLTASYKSLAAAQKESEKAEAKRAKDEERRTKEDAKRQKEQEKSRKEQAKQEEESAGKAADMLKSGADAIVKAAATMAAIGAGLVAGALKLGIESTAAADKQRRALGYLTRTYGESSGKGRGVVQGDLAYRVTLALGAEKGVTPDVALERMRKLIDSKFSREKAELVFRVVADVGAVKGEGQAEALLGQLEAVKRLDQKVQDARDPRNKRALEFERGQAQASALDKFAESGIKTSEVLGLLSQKGEDLRHVSLRLHRGKIDADEFATAVAKVAGKDVVGAAGKGLDATINRAKIGVTSLFEGWDLSPLDEFGKKLDEALKSKSGKDLKKSIDEVGQAVLSVVKNISADDISSFFTSAASAAHALAEAIRAARDAASDLVKAGKDIGIIGEKAERVERPTREVDYGDGKTGIRTVKVQEDAEAAGKAFDDGLAKGVEAEAPKVQAAFAKVAKGGAAAANDALGIKSPSRVAMQQGGYYGAGWEIGLDRSAGRVAGAAARLAAGVARAGGATAGAGASGLPGGACGAGISISAPFSFSYTFQGQATEEQIEQARSRALHDYATLYLPSFRQALRDGREQAQGGGG